MKILTPAEVKGLMPEVNDTQDDLMRKMIMRDIIDTTSHGMHDMAITGPDTIEAAERVMKPFQAAGYKWKITVELAPAVDRYITVSW